MKSTRIVLVISWCFFLWIPTYGQQAAQNMQAAPQMNQADVQKQIEAFVDSPEFKEMQEQLAPGMGNMTKEAKDEFIKQTMQMYDYMQSLPEEEQQKMAQAIEQDVQKMLQQPAQPSEEQKVQEQLPQQDQQRPEPKPAVSTPTPTISVDMTAEPKQLLETFIEMLENISVTFSNLLRVSTDNVREHHWTKIKPDVDTTLAYVKTILGSETLINNFAAAEANVLRNQISDIVAGLEKNYEHMVTADDAMLRKLSPEDAARAQPVPKHKKKQAKKARNEIIDILYKETANIELGAKALFDKYATASDKAQLKTEISKRMPQTKPTMLTKSGGSSGSSGGYSPRNDYYSPYYGGQSYQPSDSGRSSSDRGGFSGSGGTPSKFDSKSDGVITGTKETGKKGDKEGMGKDGGAKAKSEKGAETPGKTPKALEGKGEKEYKAIKKDIDELNKLVKKNFAEPDFAKTIKELDKTTDLEKLRDTSLAIQDINMAMTTLAGDISKWLRAVDKLDDDMKSKAKTIVADYLGSQKDLQKLIGMAGSATRTPVGVERPGAQEVQGLLSECTKSYQDILNILKTVTPEAVLKTLQESLNALNAQVKATILDDAAIKSAVENDRSVTLLPDTYKVAALALQKVITSGKAITQALGSETTRLSAQENKKLSASIRAHLNAKKELAQLAGMAGNITAMPAESDTSDQAQLVRALITFSQWFTGLA